MSDVGVIFGKRDSRVLLIQYLRWAQRKMEKWLRGNFFLVAEWHGQKAERLHKFLVVGASNRTNKQIIGSLNIGLISGVDAKGSTCKLDALTLCSHNAPG